MRQPTLTLLSLGLALIASTLHAQSRPPAPPPRDISALALTDSPVPPLFYAKADGTHAPFQVGATQRGPANPVPATDTLRLFRQTQDTEGRPLMTPALEVALPAGTAPALLAFFHDPSGRVTYRLLDDAPAGHAPGTIRLVNLSADEILCKLDDQVVAVPPQDIAGTRVAVADASGFIFTYGARQPDGSIFKSPAKKLRLPRDDMRLLILFATHRELRDDARQVLIVRDARLYDRVPAASPAPALAQTAHGR
ncbi:MAG: hypothetical protein ABII82_16580 [Verrucomicrobiota bacterium]